MSPRTRPRRRRTGSLAAAALAAALTVAVAAPGADASITTVGSVGIGPGQYSDIHAVAVDSSDNVYAVDVEEQIIKYTKTGTFVTSVATPSTDITQIAVDSSDNVWAARFDHAGLEKYNTSLSAQSTLGTKDYLAVATHGADVYALAWVSGNQWELDKFPNGAGPPTTDDIATGSGTGQLAAQQAGSIQDQMAIDSGGTIYIDDIHNQRVIELNGSTFAPLSSTLTGFSQAPASIAAQGTQIYVGDSGGNGAGTLDRFSGGVLQSSFQSILGAAVFDGGLALDSLGDVYVGTGASGGPSLFRIDTTPDVAIAPSPNPGLTSQTVAFSGAASKVDLWGVSDYRWDLDASNAFATDTLAVPSVSQRFDVAGTYPIGLRVTGTNGRVATATVNYTVGPSSAAITAPASALTGDEVTFDASPSIIPSSTVTDFAWSVDGAAGFPTDTGTTPSLAHAFATPGDHTVAVQVTRVGGRIDTATATVHVTPKPPAGPVGVSIDGGAQFTDDPHVTLTTVWPAGASTALIANDGGFAEGQKIALAHSIPWTLPVSGRSERLPRIVYLRFSDSSHPTETFTDDIILDTIAPTIGSAAMAARVASAGAHSARHRASRTVAVKLTASDNSSGVASYEATTSRARPGAKHRLAKAVYGKRSVRTTVHVAHVSGTTVFVRVYDRAGNPSRWHSVHVR